MLQRKLQIDASVTKLPDKTETGKQIALQGSVMHDVAKFLLDGCGIDASFFDINNRSKAGSKACVMSSIQWISAACLKKGPFWTGPSDGQKVSEKRLLLPW